jgi:hypothetical protein
VQRSGETPDQTWRRRAVNRSVGSPSSKVRKDRAGNGGRSISEVGAILPRVDHGARKAPRSRNRGAVPFAGWLSRAWSLTPPLRRSRPESDPPVPRPREMGKVGAIDGPSKGPWYVEWVTRGVRESASRGFTFPSSSPLEGNTSTRGLSGRRARIRGGRSRRSGASIAISSWPLRRAVPALRSEGPASIRGVGEQQREKTGRSIARTAGREDKRSAQQ